jgi:hypothetical protein
MYLISVKLRAKLDVLHADPNEDGIHLDKPLGKKVVVEVHFPPTRKFKRVNKKVQLAVYEVRGSKLKEIDAKKFTINAQDAIQPVLGTITSNLLKQQARRARKMPRPAWTQQALVRKLRRPTSSCCL